MQSGKCLRFQEKSEEKLGNNIRQNAYEPCEGVWRIQGIIRVMHLAIKYTSMEGWKFK